MKKMIHSPVLSFTCESMINYGERSHPSRASQELEKFCDLGGHFKPIKYLLITKLGRGTL